MEFCDDEPDWRPLEAIVPPQEWGGFMYMGCVRIDGRRLHHYKHVDTRRYLFVTDTLTTYRYTGTRYVRQPRPQAIAHVFEGLEEIREGWRRLRSDRIHK